MHPGADEVPYDGADNDCDPGTPDDDLDGDGFSVAQDCDDDDGSVNPDAVDIARDGIDQDCTGLDLCRRPSKPEYLSLDFTDEDGYVEMDRLCSDYPDGVEAWILDVEGSPTTDFSELRCVCAVTADTGGILVIADNPYAVSLAGISALERVDGSFYLYDNNGLTDLVGLGTLESVGDPASEPYTTGFRLGPNDGLTSLAGLDSLEVVYGEFDVGYNIALADLSGTPNLEQVDILVVTYNGALTSLEGLHVGQVTHAVWVEYQPSMVSLDGLPALSTLEERLSIHDNDVLTDISALAGLSAVGTFLVVFDNASLVELNGLEDVRRVGSSLGLDGNALLADVSALHGVEEVGGDLEITDNPSLPTSAAEALRDAIDSIGGTVTISGNAP